MAWEWVSPVASAASAIVAAGIAAGFTWHTGHQGRKHVEEVAKQSAASQLALAREARRATVYSDTYKIVARVGVLFEHENAKTAPPVPLSDVDEWTSELLTCSTQIALYGSPEVQKIYSAWSLHINALHNRRLRREISRENDSSNTPLMQEDFEEARKALHEANKQLREQMNRELTS